MTFIVTSSGDELDLKYPRPSHMTIQTVAWSLAQINRFNGHALRPYSVAEHSLLVSEIAEREFGLDAHGQLAALMHDAHECVTGDMHTPGKREIGGAWDEWEIRWMMWVHRSFSLLTARASYVSTIQQADRMALATERRDLVPAAPTPWPILAGVQPVGWVRLNAPDRAAHGWGFWRDRFIDRFEELDFARTQHSYPVRQMDGSDC